VSEAIAGLERAATPFGQQGYIPLMMGDIPVPEYIDLIGNKTLLPFCKYRVRI
jgi:hypothetical protein